MPAHFDDLADILVFRGIDEAELNRLGYYLKPGKAWADLVDALSVDKNQGSGFDTESMLAKVASNIQAVLDYRD